MNQYEIFGRSNWESHSATCQDSGLEHILNNYTGKSMTTIRGLTNKEIERMVEEFDHLRKPLSLDPKTSKEGKLKVCSKALHPEFSYPLIAVAEMSIEKGYKPLNWLDKNNKVTMMYLIEAAQRHLDQVKLGIDINTEEKTLDGQPTKNQPFHAAQVAYNMLMLVRQMQEGVAIDDRHFQNGELK
jgi:hypothetical protein